MKVGLLTTIVIVAQLFVISCATAPQNIKLARIGNSEIVIDKGSFEPDRVGKREENHGIFSKETIATEETLDMILDQYLQAQGNRSKVVEAIERNFPKDVESSRQSDRRAIPRYEALIIAIKKVFEEKDDPEIVYKITKKSFESQHKFRFFSEFVWNGWLENVRENGLESQIIRIQKLIERKKHEPNAEDISEKFERQISDPDNLRLFANVQMAEDYSAFAGRKVGTSEALGTYARELEKKGVFKIYDPGFERYFWSEYPPITESAE